LSAHPFLTRLQGETLTARTGSVRRIFPTYLEADGPSAALGDLCHVAANGDEAGILAQVTAVLDDRIILSPIEQKVPTQAGARVALASQGRAVPVGDGFVGRAIDAMGRPIDGGPQIVAAEHGALDGQTVSPMERRSPRTPLQSGVRAIDGLLTLGQGQRIGVFAAAGVGKTSLMVQLASQVLADHCVICLVGERGREVEAFWNDSLSPAGRSRSTLVAATSDQTAAMRLRAANYALSLAEAWRAKGRQVLLLVDSMTRLAMALREIGLAAGEPPTMRAYTPSVFATIPRLVERCGALKSGGSITAVMTVLSENDEVEDPISELMKSLLDGHIILSRSLAERGHFPAIDVPRSVSRLAPDVMSPAHRASAQQGAAILSTYEASRTLIETGLYVAGSSAEIDLAIARRPALMRFLAQDRGQQTDFAATVSGLTAAVGAHVSPS